MNGVAMLEDTARQAVTTAREALLLERASRLAASYPEGQRARMRALVRAGRERAFVADAALEDGHAASALSLYREAALLLMQARVAVEALDPPAEKPSAAEVLVAFRALPVRGTPPGGLGVLDALVASEGAAPAVVEPSVDAARATVRWLGSLVEPRGLAELRFSRGARVGAAALLAVALAGGATARLVGRQNIALHKPVHLSGAHPAATFAPGGLTDGVIGGAPYGVHTAVGDAPWVEVDLLGLYRIDKVKVYNRGDGFLDDVLPLTLQTSENGVTFVDVETRTTTFSQSSPWVARPRGRTARYVRIRGARGKYVALSELEVYAK